MGTPADPGLVKPVVGVLAASPQLLDAARQVIATSLAPIDLASAPVEWTVSTYYQREMGREIWRQYLSLEALKSADELVRLKRRTNELEERWRTSHGRSVNLDPGYVDLDKLVLASTKNTAHRVYIGHGIYAEATLHYAHGRFQPWPYTYPDYTAADAIDFFTRVRERLRAQCRVVTRQADRPAD